MLPSVYSMLGSLIKEVGWKMGASRFKIRLQHVYRQSTFKKKMLLIRMQCRQTEYGG